MNDTDEIKSRLDIVELIGERVTLKKAGRNFKGLCPFHTEKTPSFMVSPDRQTFHCFGCAKGGSVIDFVMEYEHIDFIEALEQLAGRAGIKLTKRIGDSPEQKRKEQLYEVNAKASEFYQYILLHHTLGEKALLYLKNRGISDKSIKTFGLGYSPNSWDALSLFLKKKKYDEHILAEAGLVVRGSHGFYDRFRGRVMFPLRDHRGNIVGFSGRVLDSTIKEAKYINTSETPVYSKSNQLYGLDVTKDSIVKTGEVICMEGELDLISSFQEGVSNVVAIKGSALTEGHVHLLKRFAKTVIFCLDSDTAGDAASRRGIDIAENAGLEMKAIIIPSGKDPDEAVREDPVGFKKAVKDAVPIYDFFLLSVKKRYDLSTASGKKKASEEILPVFSRMTNAIVKGHYVKKFATMLGVSEESVQDEMKKIKLPIGRSRVEEQEVKADTLSRQEKIELYTLALLLQGNTKELWNDVARAIPSADISYPGVRRIFEEIQHYVENHENFSIQEFAKVIPSEFIPLLDKAYLWDTSSIEQGGEEYLLEWRKTVRELHRTIIRAKIQELNKKTENVEDPELQEKLSLLTKELSTLEKSNEF
jgi:DNA primase